MTAIWSGVGASSQNSQISAIRSSHQRRYWREGVPELYR